MSERTAIEWTEATWNPVVGCTQVSPGCAHCYAKTLHDRRHKAFLAGKKLAPQYAVPFEHVQMMPARLRDPLSRRAPTTYFVNSVSDLFHEDVPDEFLDRVFAVIAKAQRHTFQVLTKRPERMRDYMLARLLGFPLPNLWLGTSIENQRFAYRAAILSGIPARIRFISAEPLLGPLTFEDTTYYIDGEPILPLEHLHWIIVGGESGPGARPMREQWARSLRDECEENGIAFFLKQLGGVTNKRGHEKAILDGQRYTEMPQVAVA